jgi:hypothetical protein
MKTFSRICLLPVLALALLAGCEDLGVDSGGGAVTGLTVETENGAVLARVDNSVVVGNLTIGRNEQRSLRVVLRGPGGIVTPGIAESIRVTVTNSQVASWTETGTGTGTLRGGAAAGTTSMRVDLISAGTAKYTSPVIVVTVT